MVSATKSPAALPLTGLFQKLTEPALLAKPFQLMPATWQQRILRQSFNYLFKSQISAGDFDFLCGKFVAISLADINLSFMVSFSDGQLQVVSFGDHWQSHIGLSATTALDIALRQADPDTLFFKRQLTIEGDTEIGLQVKNVLDTVDLDRLPGWLFKLLCQYREFKQTVSRF